MAIDWDAIEEEVNQATEETDTKLAGMISSLTRMKDDEVEELFPTQADQEKLIELMKIVNQSTSENEKKELLAHNIEDLAGTAIKLLGKFV